ncbi:MAG: hypothetical protein JO148_16505 [Acidimicrobiia bacterium]|nr:hypothetical protein [Acidimicrobiia bacterium]
MEWVPIVYGVSVRSRVGRLGESARWFVFATAADDKRRLRYWNVIARLRRRDIEARRAAARPIHSAAVEIPAEIGFVTPDAHLLPDTSDVVAEVRRLRKDLAVGQRGDEKPYLLDRALTGLDQSSPLMRFAVDRRIVDPAAAYLGLVPKLTGITILASPHVPGPVSGSQLFHSDWEDVRQVKVFVHCSDVRDENGPLTAITAEASRRVKQALGYRYGGPEFRIPDERVAPFLSPGETASFVGPAGSVTFIDTSSCLHLGSRVRAGADERLVVQFQYVTPAAFYLVRSGEVRRPFVAGRAESDEVEALVLS